MKLWGGLRRNNAYLDDTVHHVGDEGLAGANLALLLVLAEPHAEADEVTLALGFSLLHDLHLNAHVGEVLNDGTTGTLNSQNSGLDRHLDC